MKILLASRNAGKLREFQALLPEFELLSWPQEAPEIHEEGAFFQENALQKAHFARDWWLKECRSEAMVSVLADDSGLCVDALFGGPGVLSARFGKGLSQQEKNRRLLDMIPADSPRTARFVCVLAWCPIEGDPWTVSGVVEGRLADTSRGQEGFGYDPIFIPEGLERTFGELPSEIKHRFSHRARACDALRKELTRRR